MRCPESSTLAPQEYSAHDEVLARDYVGYVKQLRQTPDPSAESFSIQKAPRAARAAYSTAVPSRCRGYHRWRVLLSLTVGLLQESTRRLYWMTRSNVTATDKSLALGWYSRPTVPSSTVSFNESSSQKPPMMENRVSDSWGRDTSTAKAKRKGSNRTAEIVDESGDDPSAMYPAEVCCRQYYRQTSKQSSTAETVLGTRRRKDAIHEGSWQRQFSLGSHS